MSIWVKQGNFTVSKSPEQSSNQLQNWSESLTRSDLVFINNSAWVYIEQSTVQPSATQLDGSCLTLADLKVDRCSFPERKKEKKREAERREQVVVQRHKISTVFSSLCLLFCFLSNVLFQHLPGAHSATELVYLTHMRLVCFLFLSSLVRNKSLWRWDAHSGGDRSLTATTTVCWLPRFSYNKCLSSGYGLHRKESKCRNTSTNIHVLKNLVWSVYSSPRQQHLSLPSGDVQDLRERGTFVELRQKSLWKN